MDDVRRTILEAIEEKGTTLKAASLAIGRNHAYLQQFIERGIPSELPEKIRPLLANFLNIAEDKIGGRKEIIRNTHFRLLGANDSETDSVFIPEHDVRASAGSGSIIDVENEIARWPMPKTYIQNALSLRSDTLTIIEVIGDSMEPTLRSGDKIMVDLSDKSVATPGIFALYDGDATVVKRVERIPGGSMLKIKSDNPLHGSYEVPAEIVNVAGRVVWFGRRL